MKIQTGAPGHNVAGRGWPRAALPIALPIALVLAATLTARAYDTSWIVADGEISSSKLKADLDEVQTRLAAAGTVTAGGSTTSVAGTFCGLSAPTTGNIKDPTSGTVGYRAAKKLCEAVTGCGPLAHMCAPNEMVRSLTLGTIVNIPQDTIAWDASGVGDSQSDCYAFQWDVVSGDTGGAWVINVGPKLPSSSQASGSALGATVPYRQACEIAGPIACCQ